MVNACTTPKANGCYTLCCYKRKCFVKLFSVTDASGVAPASTAMLRSEPQMIASDVRVR